MIEKPPDKPRRIVNPQEAAAMMRVSETTVLRMIHRGQLKARRFGRQWRINVQDLQAGTG